MLITIAITSILGITAFVWLVNRILPIRICPICAGVSGTWLGLIAAYFLGYPVDLIVPALLMGGSVVGIAYQLEKKLPVRHSLSKRGGGESAGWRTPLFWKTLFIPAGFIAAYGILVNQWSMLVAACIFLFGLSFLFLSPRTNVNKNKKVEELEEKMKNCC